MKFRHAYYTWDWQQLTQYEGLGIHASSCLDQSFLSQCMSIGSSLNPEGRKKAETTADTAQFLLYSDQLGYVGAFVSPREDVSGKNRVNMLCHIFAALEKPEQICLEDYLVDYAYHTEIRKNRSLQTEEYIYQDKKKNEKYMDLIEKYNFHPEKMAVFLWRFYQSLFEMKNGMTILIDRHKQPDVEKDGQIAKEITWLLSCLYPKKEFEKNRWYQKLTYGVYTTENTSAINLHYTDDKLRTYDFDLYGDYHELPVEVPPVFIKMGELAAETSFSEGNMPYDKLQNFLNELREDGQDETLRYTTMDISYEKWKLNHMEDYVMEEESLRGMLKELMRGSKNSSWYKELFYQAVKKADIQDKKMLRQLWNSIVMNQIPAYEEMEEKNELHDISYALLNDMYGVSRGDYETALKSLPEEARQDVLKRFMKAKPEIIIQELEQISDRKFLEKCLNKYGSLCSLEYPDVVDLVLDAVWDLYEDGNRKERHGLSELLLKEVNIPALYEGWKQCLEDWLEGLEHNLDEFLGFVEDQGENFEQRIVNQIYDIFVSYGNLAAEAKEGFEPLWEAEDTFRSIYKSDIPPVKIQSFDQVKENLRIERKVNRIKEMTLDELLCEPLDDVPHEKCYHRWFLRANELLYQRTPFGGENYTKLSDEQFQTLLAYRESGWNLLHNNNVDNLMWKKYDEKWSEFDQILKRGLKGSTFSRRFFYYTSVPHNGTKLWNELNVSDYRELYQLVRAYPNEGQILEQAQDKSNGKKDYMLWRTVYQGRTTLSRMDRIHVDKTDHRMDYFDALYDTFFEKSHVTPNDLTNLCMILYFKFYYPHKRLESVTKRERQYKAVLENREVCAALERAADVRIAKGQLERPFDNILTELTAVKYSVDVLKREDSSFTEWIDARKNMRRNFGKDETEGMKELEIRIEDALLTEKLLLEELLTKMRGTMTDYEFLMKQKKELLRQLRECEASLKKIKIQAEEEQEEAQKQKEQYIGDADIAGIRIDQMLISNVNQTLRKYDVMSGELVEDASADEENSNTQTDKEEPDENQSFSIEETEQICADEKEAGKTETDRMDSSFDRKSFSDDLFE